jgi:urea ABC transporter ATP-binding protein UrtD
MSVKSLPILRTESLEKRFGGLYAIDGLDFSLQEGELRCLIGPNGAGKTTFFNLVTGYLRPNRGAIFFKECPITGLPPHIICHKGIGRKFQVPNVFYDLSVADNLSVARYGKSRLGQLFFRVSGHQQSDEIEHMLEVIGLQAKRDYLASALSHGEKQWLEIGMALINKPSLLLLDEPTAGMTAEETRETAHLIKRLAQGLTTVVIEHDIKFVREIAEIVTVLHRGKVLAEGPFQEIADNETVRNIYLGRGTCARDASV